MYEIGDKVIYQGADKNAYKKVGVLKSIEEKDGKPQLTVEFENGETFTAPVDDWSREFTNACRNANMNLGDVVRKINRIPELSASIQSGNTIFVEKVDDKAIGSELIDDYIRRKVGGEIAKKLKFRRSDEASSVAWYDVVPNSNSCKNAKFKVGDKVTFVKSGEKGTVNEVYGDEWYAVWRDGATYPDKVQGYKIKAANSRVCTSTNSVVRNAMAANRRVARNGNEWIDDSKKKKAMDAIDAKADALYKQLADIARKFDALKKEQVKVGYYFADYSDAARQIREIHGMQ